MPKRKRTQRVEEESRRAFADALGEQFLFRDEVPDYAIDGGVEEFDEDDNATGLRYLVQLKATDETELSKALSRQIPLDRATYYAALPLPVLMVRYLSDGGRLFVRWFHDQGVATGGGKGEAKSITFRWREEDEMVDGTGLRLAEEARNYLALRSAAAPFPFPFSLICPEPIAGVTAAELTIALRHELKGRRDVIDLRPDAPHGTGRFRVAPQLVAIELPGMTAASLELDGAYDPGPGGRQLAIDILALTGVAFARFDQADAAGRLASSYFSRSTLAHDIEAALYLASAMSRARQVREAFEIAEAIDEGVPGAESSLPFTFAALYNSDSLTESEVEEYRAMMRSRIARREKDGNSVEAARECVNLANHFRARADPNEAIPLYKKAAKLDPGYGKRAHYWQELAGVLFGAQRYPESAEAYSRAMKLGEDPWAAVLHADALMFAGQYELSRERFKAALQGEFSLERTAEYQIKLLLLDYVIDELGIGAQDRQRKEAWESARQLTDTQDPESAERVCLDALRLDGLCPVAWWNLGQSQLLRGDEETAAMMFMFAAVIFEGDVNAWGLATILTFQHGDLSLVPLLLLTGNRFTGGELLVEISAMASEAMPDAQERQEFLQRFQSMIDELGDEPDGSFLVRGIRESGVDETVLEGAMSRLK